MLAHFQAARVWVAVEDWLNPTLRLTAPERALYCRLVRLSHLRGRRTVRLARQGIAVSMRWSIATTSRYLCALARKRCIRFRDRSQAGMRVVVYLPGEIARRWASAPRTERLAFFRPGTARNASGPPRAWLRVHRVRRAEFRARILRREAGRCFYCLRLLTRGKWTLDHIVPLARGGTDGTDNLVACCVRCNSSKGALPAEQFLLRLVQRRILPRRRLRGRLRALARLRAQEAVSEQFETTVHFWESSCAGGRASVRPGG
ncbi:MAG: HNH endonuclease [Firmicutes bacterium]|nr:HNH endonuclease [Bacillota bacterium]